MELSEFLDHLNSGKPVESGSEPHQFMHRASQKALRITAEINTGYHTPEELRKLFSQLIGQPVDEKEHPHRQTCLHQHGLQVPGSGGHFHR